MHHGAGDGFGPAPQDGGSRGDVSVGPGEELEVRVERTEKEETLVWRKTFSTGPLGTWLTTYGFNFIPSRDKRYFLEPTQEGGSFKITRDTDRRELDFSPSIYFSWMPSRWRSSTRIGPSAGLGFDLSAPIVFAGLSILYNWNLGLFFGGVIHQQSRLRGDSRRMRRSVKTSLRRILLRRPTSPTSSSALPFGSAATRFQPRRPRRSKTHRLQPRPRLRFRAPLRGPRGSLPDDAHGAGSRYSPVFSCYKTCILEEASLRDSWCRTNGHLHDGGGSNSLRSDFPDDAADDSGRDDHPVPRPRSHH